MSGSSLLCEMPTAKRTFSVAFAFAMRGCDAGFYLFRFYLARDDHELVAADAVYLAVDRRTVTTESLLHYLYSLKNNVSQK